MMNSEAIKKKIDYNYQIAGMIIERWYEKEHYIETEELNVGTTEKLLKLIHKEELFCRKLVEYLPCMPSAEICMTIYGECVYGKYRKFHEIGYLHIYAIEAIRILLYGNCVEREHRLVAPKLLFELLQHIEIMVEAKELAQMMEACILCDDENVKLNHGHFIFSERDNQIMEYYRQHYNGKGLRLRIAEKTAKLLFKDIEKRSSFKGDFVESIQRLLSDSVSGKDITFFKGTYYEFFPAVKECDYTYKEFLKILLEKIEFVTRYEIFFAYQYNSLYSYNNYNVSEMKRLFGYPFIIPSNVVKKHMVFEPKWKKWNITEKNSIQLLNAPIVQNYDGKYMTSLLLCLDALNVWVEDSIYRDSDTIEWKIKMCQKIERYFEDEVKDYMRKHQFEAGQLEQNGMWHVDDSESGIKDLHIILPGEVDILAVNYSEKIVYLIECKCIHDILTVKGNIYQKFKNIKNNLSGKYVQKIKKKREVIQGYMEKNLLDYQLVTAIVTDLDFPVYILDNILRAWEENIFICDFPTLKNAILQRTLPHSFVEHL